MLAHSVTRRRISSLTSGFPVRARETVIADVPRWRAMSVIVGGPLRARGIAHRGLDRHLFPVAVLCHYVAVLTLTSAFRQGRRFRCRVPVGAPACFWPRLP